MNGWNGGNGRPADPVAAKADDAASWEASERSRGQARPPTRAGRAALEPALKVGELAERTGLSVRALHHYDEIGLLTPSGRSESGHRLYGWAEVARLQRIISLRQLGFALTEIRDLLARSDRPVRQVVELHAERLRAD